MPIGGTVISFTFNPTRNDGPFKAKLEVIEKKTNITHVWENDSFRTNSNNANLQVSLSTLNYPKEYIATFFLDGNMVYKKIFKYTMELPF